MMDELLEARVEVISRVNERKHVLLGELWAEFPLLHRATVARVLEGGWAYASAEFGSCVGELSGFAGLYDLKVVQSVVYAREWLRKPYMFDVDRSVRRMIVE